MVRTLLAFVLALGLFCVSMATDRVAQARRHCEASLREQCAELHVAYPPSHVFIRAYKLERQMEVWVS